MSAADSDPAETIAQALGRLRGRGGRGGAGRRGPWESASGRGGHEYGDHDHPGGGNPAHGHGHDRGHHAPFDANAHAISHPWMHAEPHGAATGRIGGPARLRMLDALAAASHPLGVSELADAIGVDQPRASRLVQQGVAHGMLKREVDPDDARRTRVALTDDGRAVVRGIRGERRELLTQALADFTPTEQTELARLLTKLADAWPTRPRD